DPRHLRLQHHRARMAGGAGEPAVAAAATANGEPPMLIDFLLHLRKAKLPVSIKEYLMLLEAMREQVIGPSIDDFYWLSRASLVKDERNFDKFDRAFAVYFKGVQAIPGIDIDVPLEWLKRQFQREFSAEEKAAIEAMGGLDKLMDRLRELLEEQKERHEGGSKWIGTN